MQCALGLMQDFNVVHPIAMKLKVQLNYGTIIELLVINFDQKNFKDEELLDLGLDKDFF